MLPFRGTPRELLENSSGTPADAVTPATASHASPTNVLRISAPFGSRPECSPASGGLSNVERLGFGSELRLQAIMVSRNGRRSVAPPKLV